MGAVTVVSLGSSRFFQSSSVGTSPRVGSPLLVEQERQTDADEQSDERRLDQVPDQLRRHR
jgi:hypothetical protein